MSDRDIYSNGSDDYGDGYYNDEQNKYSTDTDIGNYYQNDSGDNRNPKRQPVRGRNNRKNKGTFRVILKVFFIVPALLILSLVIFMTVVLARVHYSEENPDHSISENDGINLRSESGIENILIFGEDNHQDGEHGRADTMILLTLDKKRGMLKQTSFMRDIYLYIPGYYYAKLNEAYAVGGAKLSAETIEYNFGIKIDSYIIVDFNSFTDIVNSLGGIDIDLTYDEIEYINWQSYRNNQTDTEHEIDPDSFNYEYNDNDEYVTTVHLNGRQALWYARDRDSAGSDFDRTKRQRIVIDTILSKFKNSDPIKLMAAMYSSSEYITTNMNAFALCGKSLDLLSALGYERSEHRVPTGDNYYDVRNETGEALQIDNQELENQRLYDFIFDSVGE